MKQGAAVCTSVTPAYRHTLPLRVADTTTLPFSPNATMTLPSYGAGNLEKTGSAF